MPGEGPKRLARWDTWSGGHWGTAGARTADKGSWGGKNVAVTRTGRIAPVSASRPFTFDNLVAGQVDGEHWAWGTDGRVYFLQRLVASAEGLTLAGSGNSFASTPDAAAWDVSGVFRITARIKMNDWTPAAASVIVSHWNVTGNLRSWMFQVNTGGGLQFAASGNGTSAAVDASSVGSVGAADGETWWVGVEYNTATGALTFYKHVDQALEPAVWSEWAQISTATVTATALFGSSALVYIGGAGAGGTTTPLAGKFYRGSIYDDGVAIATPDFTNTGTPRAVAAAGTYTDSTGKVWTVGNAAAIAGVDAAAGTSQLRRFLPEFGDLLSPVTIQNIGSPINTPARPVDWFESGGKLYLTIWSEGTWEIDPVAPSLTKLTGGSGDAPGGRAVVVYGERMIVAGLDDGRFGAGKGNRVAYSDAADFTSWPTDNFFDAGADPSEIGGLYNLSDTLVIVFSDQQIWVFRGVPGGAASLRRTYGFHSGAGGTNAFSPRDGAVDPSQNRLYLYDHSIRGLAKFSGTQFARVAGFGVTTVTRAEVGTVSGGVLAIGGPDDIFVDQVPMPRTQGQSASGDNLELIRVNGASALVERAVISGSV